MEKRGQNLTLSTIILAVLGITVLVLLIYGFYTGWDYFFSKIGLLPDDLETAVQTCGTYADNPAFALSFCGFDELRVNGRKGWYNCPYVYDQAVLVLDESKIGFTRDAHLCDPTSEVNKCQQIADSGDVNWESIYVNGIACGGSEGLIRDSPFPS